MRVAVHQSVPFLSKRLGIWQRQATHLGVELFKHAAGKRLQAMDTLMVASSMSWDELKRTSDIPSACQVVTDSWVQACIDAGKLLPTEQYKLPAAGAAAAAAGPHTGKRTHSDGRAIIGAAAKRVRVASHIAEDAGQGLTTTDTATADGSCAPHEPVAAAAALGNAQTADALRSIISNRRWVQASPPQQQQQQQHPRRQDTDLILFSHQHHQQPSASCMPPRLQDHRQPQQQQQQEEEDEEEEETRQVLLAQQKQQQLEGQPPKQQYFQMLLQNELQAEATQQQQPEARHAGQTHAPQQQSQLPPPQQQQERRQGCVPGCLDVSWMDTSAIRVVSYNILADCYINGGSKRYCPAALRMWSSRWPRLAGEIAAYQPDILCMQEVDESKWLQQVQPWLAGHLNLQGLYWSRAYGRSTGDREGIALLFNQQRFKLLHQTSVRFADHALDQKTSFWQHLGTSEEGAIFALLQCSVTSKLLCAACTHLWYHPKDQDVKVGQTDILCKCLADFLSECGQKGLLTGCSSCSCNGSCSQVASRSEDACQKVAQPRHAAFVVADTGDSGVSTRQCTTAAAPTAAAAQVTSGGGLHHQQGAAPGVQQVVEQQQQQHFGAVLSHQVPVVLCGDFNSLWRQYTPEPWPGKVRSFLRTVRSSWAVPACGYSQSGVYTLLSTGTLASTERHHPKQWRRSIASSKSNNAAAADDTDLDAITFTSHGLQMQSAYFTARGHEPPITNKHPGFAGCLDYVWLSPASLDVAGTLAMPYEMLGYAEVSANPALVPFESIPNGVWPSDHLAVGAVLLIK